MTYTPDANKNKANEPVIAQSALGAAEKQGSRISMQAPPPPPPPSDPSTNMKVIDLPVPQLDPFNQQATKRYIFNETGNIMLASTELASDQISQDVRDIFAEVSVFFAAMTRAMSTSINPATKRPYSIYDYEALEGIIGGSGLFTHVSEEDVTHTISSWGVSISKELIEALLGLATGSGEMAFAQALVSSIGKRGLQVGASQSTTDGRVGTIVFVCEYLLGMPIVSAIVVYTDAKAQKQSFQLGPCIKEQSSSLTLQMHKDTYMFVTPSFIRKYSGDLLSVDSDMQYLQLVDYLQDLVEKRPTVTGVQTADGQPAPDTLTVGTTYYILGAFLCDEDNAATVTLGFISTPNTAPAAGLTANNPQSNVVGFTPTVANSTALPIGIFATSTSTTPIVTTTTSYKVA